MTPELLLATYATKTDLLSKCDVTHQHSVSDVNGLDAILSQKSQHDHTHTIQSIIGLPGVLQSLANINHSHTLDDLPEAKEQLSIVNQMIDLLTTQLHQLSDDVVILQQRVAELKGE